MQSQSIMYKKRMPLLIFLIPALVFMTVYLYIPFVQNIIGSFQEIQGLSADKSSGWQSPWYANYSRMFGDSVMRTALGNTMWMMLATIVFQVGIALILALLVDRIRVGSQFFRTVFFFPIVISATALGLMFSLIFRMDGGLINQMLAEIFGWFGREFTLINWRDAEHWTVMLFTPVMWQYIGFYFVIIVTGLNNISTDIYEAADIDGASPLQTVFRIKLPLLHNTLCTCLVLAITGALKVFDLPWTMFPNGKPSDLSWLTGTYMYKQTLIWRDVDYGSAIAVLIVVLGIVLSRLANTVLKEKDY